MVFFQRNFLNASAKKKVSVIVLPRRYQTIRDATVAFGAGYGALLPVERRIVQYLRQQRLLLVGGNIRMDDVSRSCYSLDVVAVVWVTEAPTTEAREGFGLCVLRGYRVVGDQNRKVLSSCECLDGGVHT